MFHCISYIFHGDTYLFSIKLNFEKETLLVFDLFITKSHLIPSIVQQDTI